VPENVTGTIYQAVAADPDGDVLTYSISGVDSSKFTITSQGALSFKDPPDFDNPNSPHVYQIVITASDNKAPKEMQFQITVTNLPDQIGRVAIGTGYVAATQSIPLPGGDDLLVAQENGEIFLLDPATGGTGTPFMSVTGTTRLLSMAMAPDYATNGKFYVSLLNSASEIEVRRYQRLNATKGDPASTDTILSFPYQMPANTALATPGGWIGFGPDSYLYVGTGDNGSAQSLGTRDGKILRVDVRSDAFPGDDTRDYAIPADNPFVAGAVPEIYAYGFRNPKRASFNGADLLIGDNYNFATNGGKEIDLLRPQDKGGNYGYGVPDSTPNVIDTVIRWTGFSPRGTPQNSNVVGGRVYRGPIAKLAGLYMFYDGAGFRWFTVPVANIRQGTTLAESSLDGRGELGLVGDPPPTVVSIDEDANFNLIFVVPTTVYRVEIF
jgi:glucose/arabinose dehydrogenase